MKKIIRSIYLSNRFFYLLLGVILLFILGYYLKVSLVLAKISVFTLLGLAFMDVFLLTRGRQIFARRTMGNKLSNADKNKIKITVENLYPFEVKLNIIDEIPEQFQKRDFNIKEKLLSGQTKHINYYLVPKERGEYVFGNLNVYVTSPLNLVSWRFRFSGQHIAKVYPSFIEMHKYELMAISNKLSLPGIKKIRKLGHSFEFEHIRDYVEGDDYRALNWKATAKKGRYMVNQYQDEKSQNIYSIIDTGRVMKMPFDGLSLVDYAINSSLILSNIALKKDDRAGLITFSDAINGFLPAEKGKKQLQNVMELLYKQKTNFKESSFEKLYVSIRRKIAQRSLLIIYTNFESMSALQRQLNYIKPLAKIHLLVLVFFENTELNKILNQPALNTEGVYVKTIAEKFYYEKKLIVKELEKHGVHAIFTSPHNLTVNTINKYIEIKARGIL